MAQKSAHLQGLIDESAPPTIHSTDLTPELCEAALNMSIDFQRQKQSTANTAVIRHPLTLSVVFALVSGIFYWKCGWIYKRGGLQLVKANLEEAASALVISAMVLSVIFTLFTRPTDIIKERADRVAQNTVPVFGLDLRDLACLSSDKSDKKSQELLDKAGNTRVVVYRDTPIAIASLVEVDDMTSKDRFVTKITGAGVRKVYWKSGIIEDLLDWTIYRSGQLNNNKAPKILVLIEVLSTDSEMKKVLLSKQFQKIESRPVSDNKLLKVLGVQYEIFGLGLNVTKLEEVEKLQTKAGATGSKRKA